MLTRQFSATRLTSYNVGEITKNSRELQRDARYDMNHETPQRYMHCTGGDDCIKQNSL